VRNYPRAPNQAKSGPGVRTNAAMGAPPMRPLFPKQQTLLGTVGTFGDAGME